jgi:type VI secretion system protein VasD
MNYIKQENNMQQRNLIALCSSASSRLLVSASMIAIAGCGAWQATKDTTVGAAQWVFTTQVKTMNIDLDARAAANETAGGQSLSTVVRFYQLKDAQAFTKLEYAQLQNNDLELLKADLFATKDVVLRPGASASVSEPMDKDAEFVGVVAFFRAPGSNSVWKLTIPKKQWKDTDPVKIRVQGNVLAYEGADSKPVKHEAPQQSTPGQKASPGKEASSVAGTAVKTAPGNAANTAANSAAALGNAADSVASTSATAKTAAQSVNTAADSLANAKTGASALSKSAAGLLAK